MRGFTRYLRRSRVFVRATEGDFIDICVVRGMFCIVSEGVSLAIYPLSHNTPPEAARGKPGAVQTWVLTAHPESAPDGLLKGKIDLFGALRGVPPMRGPPSRDLKGFTRYLRRSRVF